MEYTYNSLTRNQMECNGWIDKEEFTLFCRAEREQRQGNGTVFVVLKYFRPSTI